MIKVNRRDFEWEEGLTVEKLLEKKRYVFPKITDKGTGTCNVVNLRKIDKI